MKSQGRWSRGVARVTMCGVAAWLVACGQSAVPTQADDDADGFSAPTAATIEANRAVAQAMPEDHLDGMDAARRGLIAEADDLVVKREDGRSIWDIPAYDFVEGEAPDSVHPGLWRQTRMHTIAGLFEVQSGIYQLRGFDLANMTLIRGEQGWIVIDPLTNAQTTAAAWAFAMAHLEPGPITAVLMTHSHVDHFGGVEALVEFMAEGAPIVAPEGFMEEATSENVLAGPAMQRRAGFMYGRNLPRSPRGHIDTGLGKSPAFNGQIGIRQPSLIIDTTGQTETFDGVRFEFQNAPGSEAPAEFTAYLAEHKAFIGAELASRTLHNLYTLRGAKVRDALAWARYIEEARLRFAEAEVFVGSHHWPVWGRDTVQTFLKEQRDTYKYIHDQTLRLANNGLTPREIAEELELPASLRRGYHNRDYYGTVRHNSRAVYQRYFGWFDGNPANLNRLPPSEVGERYVRLAGGPEALLDAAKAGYEAADYRWVAELLSHLVFAGEASAEARGLLARTYDQLGYQSESGPWRDFYLTAAYELRHGMPEQVMNLPDAAGLLSHIEIPTLLDSMAARLNGPKAEEVELRLALAFPDLDERYLLWIENAVLHHRPLMDDEAVDVSLSISHPLFVRVLSKQASLGDLIGGDELDVSGSRLKLLKFFSLLDTPDGTFAIVEP